MAKTANINIRLEPEIKEQAEQIFSALGLSTSEAVVMFLRQTIMERGIPFMLRVPDNRVLNAADLTDKEFDSLLMEGIEDIENDRVVDIDTAFSDILGDD